MLKRVRLLATIYEQHFNPSAPHMDPSGFERREAVRAVILNNVGQVALLRVKENNFHKLPGGGIEAGEGTWAAMVREAREEIGCDPRHIAWLGTIVERRDRLHQIQTSHGCLALPLGKLRPPTPTAEERAAGTEAVWTDNLEHAIDILRREKLPDHPANTINPRDIIFLETAWDYMAQNPIKGLNSS